MRSRLSPVFSFVVFFALCYALIPPPLPAYAQEVAPVALPDSLADLLLPAVFLALLTFACWMFTEWVRGVDKERFCPKPPTVQSRLLARSIALAFGMGFGAFGLSPTLGVDTAAAHLASGMLAGMGAVVFNGFFSRLRRVLEERALAKAAGSPEGE